MYNMYTELIIFSILVFLLIFGYVYNNNDYENMMDLKNMLTRDNSVVDYFKYDYEKNNLRRGRDVDHFNHDGSEPDFTWLSIHNLLPWWNSTRRTRNMSYDIRGDIATVLYRVSPWHNSPLI